MHIHQTVTALLVDDVKQILNRQTYRLVSPSGIHIQICPLPLIYIY